MATVADSVVKSAVVAGLGIGSCLALRLEPSDCCNDTVTVTWYLYCKCCILLLSATMVYGLQSGREDSL